MTRTLEGAIEALVADAKAKDRLLKAAPAAIELAREFDGDAREIARMIIDRGIEAGLNVEIRLPDKSDTEDQLSSGRHT